jgi:hypothetical protein
MRWEAPWRCCWWGSPRTASSSSGATGTPSAAQAAAAALRKGTVGSEETPVCMGRLEGTRTPPRMMAALAMAQRRRPTARGPGNSCWMGPSRRPGKWANEPSMNEGDDQIKSIYIGRRWVFFRDKIYSAQIVDRELVWITTNRSICLYFIEHLIFE